MTNRIDSAIDDMFKLLDIIDEHGSDRVRGVGFIQEMTREELERTYPKSKAQKEREQLENMRLAELERRSGCEDD